MSSSPQPRWLPADDVDRVIVSCTARLRGVPVRRLPDRHDAHGPLAAVLVETAEAAREVLTALDRPGRTLALDVERKQDLDLPAIAAQVVRHARLVPTKPNDATVRSLDVLLTRVAGLDLAGLTAVVVGTGNLGLKAALLLAERNATVRVSGRDPAAVDRTVAAVAAVLPAFHGAPPRADDPARGPVDLLVTAVSADGVVGAEWLGRLREGATVVDVGIGNVSGGLVEGAPARGVAVVRLDTRLAEAQVLWPAPGVGAAGPAQAELDGVPVVSGGLVGPRGSVVVDDVSDPRQVVGVADGVGGLVPLESLEPWMTERMSRVRHRVPRR
ncbi:hypothetical protein G7075_11180 [Phycicoccus sp. HDW14]|uniref:hypothetical protein n=1 Tax=Phycicoccus sp. HDW14 TaxID=2714941 RepID=UPI001407503D|nr:hypothetical protein [Phycicoccus sp. HDW14]QIM21563.1 hypothetical protein G7075_11180 [Phycicoccus sp. HDW14]